MSAVNRDNHCNAGAHMRDRIFFPKFLTAYEQLFEADEQKSDQILPTLPEIIRKRTTA